MTASFGVSNALKGSRSTLTQMMTTSLLGSMALVILSGASAAVAAPALGFQPNIVHVLTDDQDLTLRSMQAMPQLSALVSKAGGFNFTNAFVATPICCPSRASYLSGQYTHNHRTLQNSPATGCSSAAWRADSEPKAAAPGLAAAGYTTGFFGKYLNAYGQPGAGGGIAHVPAGWERWFGLKGNSRFYNETVSDQGVAKQFGDDYATSYFTDVVKNESLKWMGSVLGKGKPVFCSIHVPAPHRPATPAPQYADDFADEKAPRTPNWCATCTCLRTCCLC